MFPRKPSQRSPVQRKPLQRKPLQRRPPSSKTDIKKIAPRIAIIVTVITAITPIVVAYIQSLASSPPLVTATLQPQTPINSIAPTETQAPPTATPTLAPTATPIVSVGRLEGVLTDRAGNPISDVLVSIRNGPEARTDVRGVFVLNDVPAGDQLIVVEPPSGGGQLTQNITIEGNQTTRTSVVYDAETSRLGLLSITAPIDGGELEVRQDGTEYRATIFGRSDGLLQILGEFDVWVLISSERDELFWVQRPPALIDPNTNTWRARILVGSPEHPPTDGEEWDIVAAAADINSDFKRIKNTPLLSLLPPHIQSNIVTARAKIIR